ncbi:MAG: hypothetical protein RLZZ200_691 [Pseudomonadota bacterium]|jgi:putative flippase GtrA
MRPVFDPRIREFAKFLVVGGFSAVSSWCLLFVCVEVLKLHYLVAFIVVFLLVNTLAFISNGRFAFGGRGEGGRGALFRFHAISAGSLVANTLALKALVDLAGWWYLSAAVFLAIVNAPVNFVLHRKLTYRLKDDGPPSESRASPP